MLSYAAIVVDLDGFLADVRRLGAGWGATTTAKVDAIVRAQCGNWPGVTVATRAPDAWVVTLARGGGEPVAVEAQTLALRLRDQIAAGVSTTASVGVSGVVAADGASGPAAAALVAVRQAGDALGAKALGGAGRVYPTVAHHAFEPPDIAREVVDLLREGDDAAAVERVERWLHAVLRRQAGPQVVFGRWLPALILDVAAAVDPHRSADGSPDWRSTLAHTPVAELAALAGMHERTHLHGWLTACMGRLSAVASTRSPSPLIVRAEALVRARYADPELNLSSAAAELAVSPYHLAHVFRAERDTTFRRHLTGVRVRAAVGLLRRGGLRVGEVAARCGFASTRQFRTTLRREVGSSPTALLARRPA